MLKQSLIHPQLVAALANAGHGSKVLVADGNFPAATVRPPRAETVHLNLAPGLIDIETLLPVLLSAVSVEEAVFMRHPEGHEVAAHESHRKLIGEEVPVTFLGRFDFYAAVRSEDVGLVVITGDLRPCANLIITIGLP